MITFEQARERVKRVRPEYVTSPAGYETDRNWLVLLLPARIGGLIAAVSKNNGSIRWIGAYAPEYDQSRPVGDLQAVNEV